MSINKKENVELYNNLMELNPSGIKSNIETLIITPLAKDNDEAIILLIFLYLNNISMLPIIVDIPAILVNKKEYIISL